MAECRSPLAGVAIPGRYGAGSHEPPVILSERALGSLWQVAGWDDFAAAAEPILAAFGWSGLGDYRTVRVCATAECYRIAPDRLWLRAPDSDALVTAGARAATGRLALLDLSHSQCAVGVSGAGSADLLARVCALDLALPAFPAGNFARTAIHQVPVLIRRTDAASFEILVPVTWAASVWQWLCVNAEPFGYAVGSAAM